MGYIAIAPLVIAKDAENRDFYVYEGAPVPEDATEESIARLLEEGFIAESLTGAPDESWTVKQLTKFAGDNSIDLGDATKKADVLAAITAATAKSD